MMMMIVMIMMMVRLGYLVDPKIVQVTICEGLRSEWLMNVRVLSETHVPPFLLSNTHNKFFP